MYQLSKNVYNELFSSATETGQEVHENEALAREILNHALGTWWRGKQFMQEQRELLKNELFVLNQRYEGDDVFSHLMTMMPASLQWANKVDMMCKVSIMILLVAQSPPEKFAKMDEFLEKQVVIDAMLTWKTFSEMIEELLSYAWTFEAKNMWAIYNYRVDDLFHFARAAKEGLANIPEFLWQNKLTDALKRQRAKKNDPVLRVFQNWYEKTQQLMQMYQWAHVTDDELYVMYWLANKKYYDAMKHEMDMQFINHIVARTLSWEMQTETIQVDSNTQFLSIEDHPAMSYLTERQSYQPDFSYELLAWFVLRKYKKDLFIKRSDTVELKKVSQLNKRLIALCIEYYHDKPDFVEQILQTQKLSEGQMLLLDKKRAEQEKLKNYNERLAIHRQGVRDTFEGQNDWIDRDAVFAFCNDPANVFTMIDPNTWDISIRLPKCGPKGMKMKMMKTDDFPMDKKNIYSEKQFLPKTKSEAFHELLYKSELRTELFKNKIDTEGHVWYFWDADRFDTTMYYLAKQFSLKYDQKKIFKNQSVFRVYMAIWWRIWRDFLNRSEDGRNWDMWWRVNNWKKYINSIQIAFMLGYYQILCRHYDGGHDASVMLMGDND